MEMKYFILKWGPPENRTFQFCEIGNTDMVGEQTCEMGSTLAPLTTVTYIGVLSYTVGIYKPLV
jgi:hypothetical protein